MDLRSPRLTSAVLCLFLGCSVSDETPAIWGDGDGDSQPGDGDGDGDSSGDGDGDGDTSGDGDGDTSGGGDGGVAGDGDGDGGTETDAGETSRAKPKCVMKESQVLVLGDSYVNWVRTIRAGEMLEALAVARGPPDTPG